MFFSESQAILGRIHSHLAGWRANGPDAGLLAAMRGEFAALREGAAAAGFEDVAALGENVESLLAQSGDVTVPDDQGLLNLLEEVHDGLVADLGFVPAAARDHVKSLKSLVALLLRDVRHSASGGLPPDEPAGAFNEFLPRLRQVAARGAEQSGRQVELDLSGGEVEVERRVLEAMAAPLEHLARRFIEHGLEPAEQRAASGKPAAGHIGIDVTRRGAELCIEYSDDGAGPVLEKLAAEAVRAGMTNAAGEVGEAHLLQILTRPGGDLEAVRRAVRDLGGLMALKSEPGRGMRLQFLLPASIGARRALLVTVGEYRLAIPAHAIERVLQVTDREMSERGGEQTGEKNGEKAGEQTVNKTVTLGDRRLALVDLAAEISPPGAGEDRRMPPVVNLVLVRLADRVTAFAVSAFHDVVPVAFDPPGPQLASIRGVTGVAVAADSDVTPVLDPDAFIHRERLHHHGLTRFPLTRPEPAPEPPRPPVAGKIKQVLLLETAPAPVLIPIAMVAAVTIAAARRSPEPEREPEGESERESERESEHESEREFEPEHEPEHEHEHEPTPEHEPEPAPQSGPEWMYGDHSWRGYKVPVVNSAAAFGAGGEPSPPWAHAVILWPMKDGRADEFFALTADRPPRMIEVEDRPVAAPRNIAVKPNHLLGYVHMDRRIALVPDLQALAREIFHER